MSCWKIWQHRWKPIFQRNNRFQARQEYSGTNPNPTCMSRINCGVIQKQFLTVYVEFRKTFDSLWQKVLWVLWALLRSFWYRVKTYPDSVNHLSGQTIGAVRISGELTNWFMGNIQGYLTSPNAFISTLSTYWIQCRNTVKQEWLLITGSRVNNLKFICRRCGSYRQTRRRSVGIKGGWQRSTKFTLFLAYGVN